ncbi:eukaryotic translation initiation factor 5B-like [Trifolium pratense]|uniref:eukaryotic translation initiation factor 5B-like n=1 Tax=Trifolium pratense TaxID=57577 RepID=UPI001E692851|nr:eukaryotic translation initiation factor 5B-like [Trifolium pratense]
MSESSQTTKSTRSTRSKGKAEASKIIKDAVPITTVHTSNIKVQSSVAEKKGKAKSVEKKSKTPRVSKAISPSVVDKSGKESSKKKRRDYKSKIPYTMSELVFGCQSIVKTSEKTSEIIEGHVAVNEADITSENMQADDTQTEVIPDPPTRSSTIAEIVAEKSTQEDVVEKDVETTVTLSDSFYEETESDEEKATDAEEDTQSDESNQTTPDSQNEPEKSLDAEKGKEDVVVDVETYEATKLTERATRGMTKSKKKENLKRKKASSSDSEYDVAEDVPNITSPLSKMKATVKKRRLAVERELTKDALKCQVIIHLIKQAGLLKTVADISPCYELLVKEFLVNIPQECDNPLSKDYQKVFVRGKCIDFSPTVINNYLGRSVEPKPELEVANDAVSTEITAGKVNVWPKNKLIPTSKLIVKYAILNRIGSTNWVSTKHATNVATGLGRFIYVVGTKVDYNYGTYIFDQTVKHIRSTAVKMPIAFPSLLCGIILDQYPNIKIITDTAKKRETAFTFHHKLFGDHNVADIVGTSTGAASLMTRMKIIATLKVQC